MHPLYIQQWTHTQGNETWNLSLQSNGYVVLEGGPHLFEGAEGCTWQEFVNGKLDALVLRYLPQNCAHRGQVTHLACTSRAMRLAFAKMASFCS